MTKELDTTKNISKLYKEISSILNTARANAYKAVNFAMVTSYWSIGQVIVEDEQNGNERAEYGKAVLEGLSKKLTAEFGQGYDVRELRKIRQFYLEFKNRDSLRHELKEENIELFQICRVIYNDCKQVIFCNCFVRPLMHFF